MRSFLFAAGKAVRRKVFLTDFPSYQLTIFLIPAATFYGINCCHARFKVLLSIALSF